MSISAYKRTLRENDNPRDNERRVFARITAALAQYETAHDSLEDSAARRQLLAGSLQLALAENLRLWSLMKTQVSMPDNALPKALRAQLISIALVVERTTTKIISGEGRVGTLVALNRPIIDGLAGIAPDPVGG